jgi:integrase
MAKSKPLTDTAIRAAKPADKPYKLSAENSLYVEIMPTGAKLWRWKYHYEGKEKRLSFGDYRHGLLLAQARTLRDNARALLKSGIDPSAARKEAKAEAAAIVQNTFENITREWWGQNRAKWKPAYADEIMYRLEKDILPAVGDRPIQSLTRADMIAAAKAIEARGALETARRVIQTCEQIFDYAIDTGRCENNPAIRISRVLKIPTRTHYPALEAKDLPAFLRVLNGNNRLYPQTLRGMWFMMMTFARTGEMIGATWEEIDWEGARWYIPADRMKMGKPHTVPLSKQALEILEAQRAMTGGKGYIWPSITRPQHHMSNQTLLVALRRLGYGGKMTGHGFRALAMSTIKEKLGYRHEVVDRQLAHAPKSKIDAAYDRAEFLAERTKMMQAWSDYLEGLV